MRLLTLSSLSLCASLLALSPNAQGPAGSDLSSATASQAVRIPVGPVPAIYHLDLDTGQESFLGPVPQHSGGVQAVTATCFDNTYDVGVADALLYPADHELMDWGVKLCGGSGYVDQITIGYSSLAPLSTGGSLTIRLYEQALGWGNPGTLRFELTLTGLPSDPTSGIFAIPFTYTIELGSQSFYLPDGPIGWSFENHDNLTGPILVDATLANGVQNFFDVYTPGPATSVSYDGTYFLPPGGVSMDPLENSFWIRINENTVTSTAVTLPGTIDNTQNLSATTSPFVNATWTAEIDTFNFPGTSLTALAIAPQRLSGAILPGLGELIPNVTLPATRLFLEAPGTPFALAIPNDPGLLGRVFYAQGWFTGAITSARLTNGLELTIGSN